MSFKESGTFVGIIGIDFVLSSFQKMVQDMHSSFPTRERLSPQKSADEHGVALNMNDDSDFERF